MNEFTINYTVELDPREALYPENWRWKMPSDPPTPAQWNLHGWMVAYQEAQRSGNPPPTSPRPVKPTKENIIMKEEPMQGGWKFEGIERPCMIRICTKCQGSRQTDSLEEPDRVNWCDQCKDGKLLGHSPEKSKSITPKIF